MNIKAITRAMELSDDDWELATKLRALSEPERELLTTALGPQKPATKKPSAVTRKIEHCAACDYTKRHFIHNDTTRTGYHEFQSSKSAPKSQRARSLSEQLKQRPRGAVTGDSDNDSSSLCVVGIDSKGGTCREFADHNVHHLTAHPDFHPFSSGARSAPPPLDQTSSEIGKGVVSNVAHGGG